MYRRRNTGRRVREAALGGNRTLPQAPTAGVSRDEMRRFVTGVSEDMEAECWAAMLNDNIDLARLMVHAQHVEESRRRKRGREGKKPRPSDQAGSNTGRRLFGVLDRPKFKKGNDRNSQCDRDPCGRCDHLNRGECMVGSNACYGFDKRRDMIRDCPQVKNQGKEDTRPQLIPTAAAEPSKRNMFYALNGREE
ncbi:uncharacterized protein LOC107022263 [Solanum pennellii]|uniref:Uncharacterized protein LOC107022263 n=1 Tax=Solanum pennellii TaxID=28526 RepID=A0ABM1H001_SOLPN|nr:uncharacterized protein LOC107022263 [Solanum pennellii]